MTDQTMLNPVVKRWGSPQSMQKQTGYLRGKQLDSQKMRKTNEPSV